MLIAQADRVGYWQQPHQRRHGAAIKKTMSCLRKFVTVARDAYAARLRSVSLTMPSVCGYRFAFALRDAADARHADVA